MAFKSRCSFTVRIERNKRAHLTSQAYFSFKLWSSYSDHIFVLIQFRWRPSCERLWFMRTMPAQQAAYKWSTLPALLKGDCNRLPWKKKRALSEKFQKSFERVRATERFGGAARFGGNEFKSDKFFNSLRSGSNISMFANQLINYRPTRAAADACPGLRQQARAKTARTSSKTPVELVHLH